MESTMGGFPRAEEMRRLIVRGCSPREVEGTMGAFHRAEVRRRPIVQGCSPREVESTMEAFPRAEVRRRPIVRGCSSKEVEKTMGAFPRAEVRRRPMVLVAIQRKWRRCKEKTHSPWLLSQGRGKDHGSSPREVEKTMGAFPRAEIKRRPIVHGCSPRVWRGPWELSTVQI